MPVQHHLFHLAAGNLVGIALRLVDVDQERVADALHRLGIEARRAEREPQQLRRLAAIVAQEARAAGEIVEPGREAELDAAIRHAFLEGLRIDVARAFVEQAGGELRDAFLADRVVARAALEAERHRDDRVDVVLDQPDLDAAVALDRLDVERQRPARNDQQAGEDEKTRDHGWAASCAGLGNRMPVTEFAGLKIWAATASTSAGVTDAMRSGQAWKIGRASV